MVFRGHCEFALLLVVVIGHVLSFPFIDLKYDDINAYLTELKGKYGDVRSVSELFGLPAAKDGSISCSPLLARISALNSLAEDVSRPQMIISGEIHGDERVGPSASLFTAQLLVLSADCAIQNNQRSCSELESMSNITVSQRNWLAYLATRRDSFIIPTANCLGYIKCNRFDAGVDPNRDFGYSRENSQCMLSTTAKIFHYLMAQNLIQVVVTFHSGMVAIGYEWGSKNHMSPQDASPDDRGNADIAAMMRTFGGKFRNEPPYPVGRINSMVYPVDGGMEDWLYAAGWDKSVLKKCDGLKDLPPVSSGGTSVTNLRGSSNSSTKTAVDSENRALVFLVEASNKKVIKDGSLGDSQDVLNKLATLNGHIPRNVRLSLVSLDLLQPYVCINRVKRFHHSGSRTRPRSLQMAESSTEGKNGTTDTSVNEEPTLNGSTPEAGSESPAPSSGNTSATAPSLVPGSGGGIHVQWYVGGATTVDHTFLSWHLPSGSSSSSSAGAGGGAVDTENWSAYLRDVSPSGVEDYFDSALSSGDVKKQRRAVKGFPVVASLSQSGYSRWKSANEEVTSSTDAAAATTAAEESASDHYHSSDPLKPLTMFSATVYPAHYTASGDRLSTFAPGLYWLVAWSLVDSSYGAVGQGQPASMGPQSHYSHARTNPKWRIEQKQRGGRVVQGRRYWPSDPIVVLVHADGSHSIQSQVTHCNYWNRVHLANSSTLDSGGHSHKQHDEPAAPVEQKTSDTDGVVYFTSDQPDVNSTWKLHHPYAVGALLFILLLACFMTLLSNWRRSRIYTSLINNKYVNLATGTSNSNIERMRALTRIPIKK